MTKFRSDYSVNPKIPLVIEVNIPSNIYFVQEQER